MSRRDDPVEWAAYMREWRARNPEENRAKERARVAKLRDADPEAFRAAARERYTRWLSKAGNREKHQQRGRDNFHRWNRTRRGLTKQDRHDYWLFREGLCDMCSAPYEDPAVAGSWKTVVVDHDHEHCDQKVGCIVCVRGQGHRVCNVIEGHIKLALDLGLITAIDGPLVEYLADPPMQRWLRQREAAAA